MTCISRIPRLGNPPGPFFADFYMYQVHNMYLVGTLQPVKRGFPWLIPLWSRLIHHKKTIFGHLSGSRIFWDPKSYVGRFIAKFWAVCTEKLVTRASLNIMLALEQLICYVQGSVCTHAAAECVALQGGQCGTCSCSVTSQVLRTCFFVFYRYFCLTCTC